MTVQFNTDHNIRGGEELRDQMTAQITEGLDHYSSHITRIEAHLTDEDGNKNGGNDKRCVLEARVEGRQPVAVTNHANNHEDAVSGAIDKLSAMLETILGKAGNHRGN